jgi:hypothetical protein
MLFDNLDDVVRYAAPFMVNHHLKPSVARWIKDRYPKAIMDPPHAAFLSATSEWVGKRPIVRWAKICAWAMYEDKLPSDLLRTYGTLSRLEEENPYATRREPTPPPSLAEFEQGNPGVPIDLTVDVPSRSGGNQPQPRAGDSAVWQSRDAEIPVVLGDEEPGTGDDGSQYVSVNWNGNKTYVPSKELFSETGEPLYPPPPELQWTEEDMQEALRLMLPRPRPGEDPNLVVGLLRIDADDLRLITTVPYSEVPVGFARHLRDAAKKMAESFWKRVRHGIPGSPSHPRP